MLSKSSISICALLMTTAASVSCRLTSTTTSGALASDGAIAAAPARVCSTVLSVEAVGPAVSADATAAANASANAAKSHAPNERLRPLTVLAEAAICGDGDAVTSWQAIGLAAPFTSAQHAVAGGPAAPVAFFLDAAHNVVAKADSGVLVIGQASGATMGDAITLAPAWSAALTVNGRDFQAGDASDTPDLAKGLVLRR